MEYEIKEDIQTKASCIIIKPKTIFINGDNNMLKNNLPVQPIESCMYYKSNRV